MYVRCVACGKNISTKAPVCPFCETRNAEYVAESPGNPAAAAEAANGPTDDSVTSVCDHAAVAEEAVRDFESHGLSLDYSVASLASVDVMLADMFGPRGLAPDDASWRPDAEQRRMILALGSYLGEVIRRRLGGTWRDDPMAPGKPLFLELVLPDSQRVRPLERAYKRLVSGSASPLVATVESVDTAGRAPEVRRADAIAWAAQASDFARRERYNVANRFLDLAIALDENVYLVWFMRGVVLEATGRAGPARAAWERALALADDEPPEVVQHLRSRLGAVDDAPPVGTVAKAVSSAWNTGTFSPPPPRQISAPVPAVEDSLSFDEIRISNRHGDEGESASVASPDADAVSSPQGEPRPGRSSAAQEIGSESLDLDDLHFDSSVEEIIAESAPTERVRAQTSSLHRVVPQGARPSASAGADAGDLVNDARQLAATGRIEEALVCYWEVLTIDPDRSDVRGSIANLCMAIGRPDEAVEVLKQPFDGGREELLIPLARAWLAAGQSQRALDELSVAAYAPGATAAVLREYGLALLTQRLWQRASEMFEAALRLDDGDADLWAGAAVAWRQLGETRRAELALAAAGGLRAPGLDP